MAIDFFRFFRKESQSRISMSLNQIGKPVMTPANYEAFAKQGFAKNLVVYAAISKIALAFSGIKWTLHEGDNEEALTEHPLLTLLNKPNPLQSGAAFKEAILAYKIIAGNSYINAVGPKPGVPPLELWTMRPDRMRVVPGNMGYPIAYEFNGVNGSKVSFPVDFISMKSTVLHMKSFHPLDEWYGLSALEAAMLSLDQNNAGQRWNLSLMQNGAQPSGVLQFKASDANPRGELTTEQYARIKSEFSDSYQGAKNAGRPLLLEGGLEWTQTSMTPKEMDFMKSKEVTAIDLCIALGVPPEIMGMGQKTFANYEEARYSFYEETVLPHADGICDALNMWLAPTFGDGLKIGYDKKDIEALTYKTSELMTTLTPVKFLTVNEKRKLVGFDEIDGGDELDTGAAPTDPNAQAVDENGNPVDENGDPIDDNGNDNSDTTDNNNDDANNVDSSDSGKKPSKKPTKKPGKNPPPKKSEDETLEWKTFNLVNKADKKKSWRAQNAKRSELERSFNRELQHDFSDLNKKLEKVAQELKGHDPKTIEFALIKAVDEFQPTLRKTLMKHIRFTFEDFGNMILREGKSLGFTMETKGNRKYEDYVNSYVERHTANQVKTITSTSEKQIRRVIKEWTAETISSGDSNADLSHYLQAEFEDLTPAKAMLIARTEVSMASNNATLESVKSLDIPNMGKEWVSAEDDRVRDGAKGGPDHTAVDGQEVDLNEKFSVPPDTDMDGPGDPSAGADQVCNCRCVLVYNSHN